MKKFQVWPGGGSAWLDIEAESEKAARQEARELLYLQRLPNNTCVCEIPFGYYKAIVDINTKQGFDATNL